MDQNPSSNPQTVAMAEPELQKIDKGAYVLEEAQFGGALQGLGYYVLQFKSGTDSEAQSSVDNIVGQKEVKDAAGNVIQPAIPGKWTPRQLVALVNSAVRSAQRVKAQQEILSEEKDKQPQLIVKRLQEKPILFSQEDAEKWVPGERELTIQGMMRKVAELTKDGKNVEAMALLLEVQKQMTEKLAEDNAAGN